MKTFRRLLSYYRYHPYMFLLGVSMQIIASIINVYVPRIGQEVIDYVSSSVSGGQAILFEQVIQLLLKMFIFILIGAGIHYVSYLFLAYVANTLSKQIRDEAHEHMQKLPVSYFDDKPAGKVAARIVNDTEALREGFYQNFGNQVIVNSFMVITTYIAMMLVNPTIGLIFLVMIPIIVVWQIYYAKLSRPINTRWREAVSELNNQTAEIVQGVSIVQVFNRQESMLEDFAKTNRAWRQSRLDDVRLNSFFSWNFAELLEILAVSLLLSYIGGAYLSDSLGMSIGTVFLLVNYVRNLFWPISQLVRLLTMLQQAIVSGSRVFELMDEPIESDCDAPLVVTEGDVVFDGITFGYKDDYPVLHDINFAVRSGQTVGLVGHTGSGKSSIINLLMRFYDPQEGTIRIDNQVIQTKNRESVRKDMGIVLQDPYLFTGTIASNISMNNPAISEETILDTIHKVGADPMIAKLDQGIHHPIHEKGQTLSSGERQLIAIARTLAADPKILILDEATSHIDTETEEIIQHAMNVVKGGRRTFIIAHRLSTIQNADLILLLDSGRIVERGTHSELMALNGQYATMYQMQAKVANLL